MLSGAGNILPVAMKFFRDDGHFLLCVCMYVGVCVLYIYVGVGYRYMNMNSSLNPLRWHLSLNLEQGWEPASTSRLPNLS